MAGPVGNFRSGKGARISVAGLPLTQAVWEVHETGVKLPTNNFECFTTALGSTGNGGGRSFTQGLIGFETATGKCTGNWNQAINPFDDPPGLYNRDDGPLIVCMFNVIDENNYEFPETLLYDCADVKCNCEGLISYDFAWENQGEYARPQGTFTS